MRKIIGKLLAWIGGFTVFCFVAIIILATVARSSRGKVPDNAVLELNLETSIAEDQPDDPFAKLRSKDAPTMRDIVQGLEHAASDSRVKGLVARIGASTLSLAQTQEVRDAIATFRAKKKFAVAFSDSIGEFGGGNSSYYLATAFDEIWLQPSGDVGVNGLMLQPMFLRGTFDKLGIVPRFDQRYEYKNAMNSYTDTKMNAPFREAMQKLLDSYYGQIVQGIAQGRQLPVEQTKALVGGGPYYGKEALEKKLVDGLAYRDEVLDKVKVKAGASSELIYLNKYLARNPLPHSGPQVALIFGLGGVQRGKSEYDPLQGTGSMGSESVTAAFRQAIKDSKVKAILFRVDSPGGSYVASDSIWRETLRAKKAGKPVIVSMGSVAGSGGYFVAMAADKIIAQPATITGSIGVLGGKFLTQGLTDKLGLSFDEVHAGEHARMFSANHDFSREEWERFQLWLNRIYEDFTSKVAEGRKLPKEKVLQIAKGRIWSGEDAKQLGLIDETGGYPAAIRALKQALKLKDTDSIDLRTFPRKKSTFEAIMAEFQDESESSEAPAAEVNIRAFDSLRPVMQKLRQAGLLDSHQDVLSMPSVGTIQ